MQRIPTLVGTRGHFQGEIFPLEYGKTVCIGRSREAEFSLRRTQKYRAQSPEQRAADASARTVSARHFQVTMYNLGSIEVKNLSPNGTRVDGKPMDVVVLDDVTKRSHEITFGQEEVLHLQMRVQEDL
jgi:hypothetical protein